MHTSSLLAIYSGFDACIGPNYLVGLSSRSIIYINHLVEIEAIINFKLRGVMESTTV
jgi:hypothetical protein